MSSRKLNFEFYVNGLEEAIIALLKNGNPQLSPAQAGMGVYCKDFATYSGELDRANLIEALKALILRFPLVLASYGSGADKQKAATGILENDPIENEHTCSFVVIVASNDLRGTQARKNIAYKMVSDVRQILGGVQFEVEMNDGGDPELLNHAPLRCAGVETIGRMKDLTAFAVHFTTTFKEWTPDRRIVTTSTANEILLDIEPTIENENLAQATNLPGVSGATNEN